MAAATARVIAPPGIETRPYASGIDHLLAELERLALMVHAEVLRMRAAKVLNDDQFRGLYIADEQIDAILYAAPLETEAANWAGAGRSEADVLADNIAEMEREIAARCSAGRATGAVVPLERLAEMYSLSRLEVDALLISMAPDLDPRFETFYSYAQNDVTRKRASIGLILRLLAPTSASRLRLRSMFAASGCLLETPLARFSDDAQERDLPFLSRTLRPDERIVNFLLEQPLIDARLRPFTTSVEATRSWASLHFPEGLSDRLRQAERALRADGGILIFHGPEGAGKRAASEALSAAAGRALVVADMRQAQAEGGCVIAPPLLALLVREALLRSANLLLTHTSAPVESGPPLLNLQSLAASVAASGLIVFIAGESPWLAAAGRLPCAVSVFEFPLPGFFDRTRIWQDAIKASGSAAAPGMAATLANQFALTGGQIHGACRMATTQARLRGQASSTLTGEHFESAARAQSNQGLRERAQKVSTAYGWADLVLPPRTLQQLRDVCAAEKYRSVIYAQWGFDRRLMQGNGLNVLFSGPSGTGKTMSAGIVARQLGLDLYKIDLSTVISKYIGDTEKQLSQIFREAQSSNAILFFDEADAIFGKRSEVKDAHDRYANVEVAYLLQKMEEYEGIVILATNFRRNIDEAFTRRIQYIVEFPFPEAQYRERIWRSLMPAGAPVEEDVDFGFLGRQFELAGGNIRNVVLVAAFLAAEEGGNIRMEHFILATSRELQKMGRLPSRSDFREYYDLTRERG